MPSLYLSEQGATLQKEGKTLLVTRDDITLMQMPIHRVEHVLVLGYVQVTTQALSLLLAHGVDVSSLTYAGKLKGRVVPAEAKNVPLRLAQYEAVRDAALGLDIARAIVRAKVLNARAVLQRYARNRPERDGVAVRDVIPALAGLADQVYYKDTPGQLMGLEGAAAATYFRAFSQVMQPEWAFAARTRRPAKDPANALLSFGYTLAGNELMAVLTSTGLDPYLGFFHTMRYGRPSLALDLLEEFRAPLVDRLTATLINLNILEPDDFEHQPAHGVVLKPPALKRYLHEWDKALNLPFKYPPKGPQTSFRRLFATQSAALARTIRDRVPYVPYRHY